MRARAQSHSEYYVFLTSLDNLAISEKAGMDMIAVVKFVMMRKSGYDGVAGPGAVVIALSTEITSSRSVNSRDLDLVIGQCTYRGQEHSEPDQQRDGLCGAARRL